MSMDSELSEFKISPTPKLSLFSLPLHTPDPPSESLTPLFQTPSSVPFKWEEAPGKPCRSFVFDDAPAKPRVARCLELPPCKITNSPSPKPSPSSVLNGLSSGPKVCKTSSFSFRKLLKGEGKITNLPSPFSEPELSLDPNVSKTMSFSFRKMLKGEGKITDLLSLLTGPELGLGSNVSKTTSFSFRNILNGQGKRTNVPLSSSSLYGPHPDPNVGPNLGASQTSFSSRGPEEDLVWKLIDKEKVNFSSLRLGIERAFEEDCEGNFDFSSPLEGPEEIGTRIRKRSGLWANFYKNVKQAVPRKRRQEKRRKTNI